MVMEIEDTLIDKLRALPREKQQEVLNFVESLQQPSVRKKQGKSLAGLWADLDIEITEEELREMRREMWANFPRDI